MKKLFPNTIAMAALGFAALLAAPARAHTPILSFDSPFAFAAGDQVLPAGQYQVTVEAEHMVLKINSINGAGVSVLGFVPNGGATPGAEADIPMVRFTKYGARYFLTGVWTPGWLGWKTVIPSHRLVQDAKAGGTRDILASDSNRR